MIHFGMSKFKIDTSGCSRCFFREPLTGSRSHSGSDGLGMTRNRRSSRPGGMLPGPVAGGKQQQPRDSERASGRWMNLLFSIVQGLGHTLPLNLRKPLIVHSMHTGMNSFRMFFRMAGIEVQDVVGAEKKDHARGFVKRNSLEPEHFYTDTADMFEHCSARDEVGYCRADIFASGFPCQPFSRMSRRCRPPQDHPLYKEFSRRRGRRHACWRTSVRL